MMIELIPVIIALTGSFIAGVVDLRTTEIPDWAIVFMLAGGGLYAGYASAVGKTFEPIVASLAMGSAAFAFGMVMYFTGQWGGGDSKLLAATLFVLPTAPSIFSPNTIFAFPLTLLLNVFLIGAAYSVVYAFIFAARDGRTMKFFLSDIKNKSNLISVSLILATVTVSWAYLRWTFGSPADTILYTIPGFAGLFFLWRFLKAVEKKGFVKRVKSSDLKEGDMIGEDVKSLGISKKVIRGLTRQEAMRISRIKKYVLVKDGVRFGPVFFLAILVSVLYGNLILLMF